MQTHNTFPPLAETSEAEPSDWRREAMRDALASVSATAPSQPVYNLMASINQHLPHAFTHLLAEEKHLILNVLQASLSDWQSILNPAVQYIEETKNHTPFPIYGWWRGRDPLQDDVEFDIVLTPSTKRSGGFLIVGPAQDVLASLIQRTIQSIEKNRSRDRLYNRGWQESPEIEAEIAKTSWSDIVLAPKLRSDIQNTVQQFFDQQEAFLKMRFPWRRGILLVGPPGTGKTMVCKATAAAFPQYRFLYVRDISQRANEIEQVFQYARQHTPCILAFEDVDSLFGDTNRAVFLNELDGFQNNDGLLIIASSNHPERIDVALLKRPSRFDRVYHIGLPAEPERRAFAEHLLARAPHLDPSLDQNAFANRVADLTEGFTPAFIKEAFISAMLQETQEGRTELGDTFARGVFEQIETLRTLMKQADNPATLNEVIGSASGEMGFRRRRAPSTPADEEE